jgi:hypothetical protein
MSHWHLAGLTFLPRLNWTAIFPVSVSQVALMTDVTTTPSLLVEMVFHNHFAQAGFKPRSSRCLPPEWLELWHVTVPGLCF